MNSQKRRWRQLTIILD